MAYNKEKLLKQALDAIKKHNLFFADDVIAYIPCVTSTYYDLFPKDSKESNSIKEALDKNRTEVKVLMRDKWYKSDNATLQIGLMKLIGTEEEAHRLNGSSRKIEGSLNIKASLNYTDEEREQRIDELLKKKNA